MQKLTKTTQCGACGTTLKKTPDDELFCPLCEHDAAPKGGGDGAVKMRSPKPRFYKQEEQRKKAPLGNPTTTPLGNPTLTPLGKATQFKKKGGEAVTEEDRHARRMLRYSFTLRGGVMARARLLALSELLGLSMNDVLILGLARLALEYGVAGLDALELIAYQDKHCFAQAKCLDGNNETD